MSVIPGLDPIPIGNVVAPIGEEIKFKNLDGTDFVVPEAHRYGTCRPESDFEKIDHVGEGAYGKVYKARDLKKDEIVAMKRLKATSQGKGLSLKFLREVNILKELENENIVNLLDVVSGKELDQVFLVLEYCPYELANVIDDLFSMDIFFQIPHVKCIMTQLFAGLLYLHNYYVIHRDIKVSNILFTANGCLKIADFGMSRKYSDGAMTPNTVSLWYRAPEILFGSTTYTTAIDVWAAGCIFAELILKKPLFTGRNEMTIITEIIDKLGVPTEEIWPGCTKLPLMKVYHLERHGYNYLTATFGKENHSSLPLIQRIFVYNPEKRITAKKCLHHRFFHDEPAACSLSELAKLLVISKSKTI